VSVINKEGVLKSTPHLASPHERGGIFQLPSLHREGLGEGWIVFPNSPCLYNYMASKKCCQRRKKT